MLDGQFKLCGRELFPLSQGLLQRAGVHLPIPD